jgi:hypothetical protein
MTVSTSFLIFFWGSVDLMWFFIFFPFSFSLINPDLPIFSLFSLFFRSCYFLCRGYESWMAGDQRGHNFQFLSIASSQ